MKTFFVPLALVILLTGCRFGSANFEGEINGHDFDVSGTVFSYEDHIDALGVERDEPILRVAMMYISIDPLEDLADKSGDEVDRLIHENSQRDVVTFGVIDPNTLIFGEALEQERIGLDVTGDEAFFAHAQFRPEILDETSTYADFAPYGSRETIRFSPIAFDDAQTLSGDLSIDIAREEGDAANARTATITGDFIAPRVPEAIAEKNLRTLRIFLSDARGGLAGVAP